VVAWRRAAYAVCEVQKSFDKIEQAEARTLLFRSMYSWHRNSRELRLTATSLLFVSSVSQLI
jgi:hypothetical protein